MRHTRTLSGTVGRMARGRDSRKGANNRGIFRCGVLDVHQCLIRSGWKPQKKTQRSSCSTSQAARTIAPARRAGENASYAPRAPLWRVMQGNDSNDPGPGRRTDQSESPMGSARRLSLPRAQCHGRTWTQPQEADRKNRSGLGPGCGAGARNCASVQIIRPVHHSSDPNGSLPH